MQTYQCNNFTTGHFASVSQSLFALFACKFICYQLFYVAHKIRKALGLKMEFSIRQKG